MSRLNSKNKSNMIGQDSKSPINLTNPMEVFSKKVYLDEPKCIEFKKTITNVIK